MIFQAIDFFATFYYVVFFFTMMVFIVATSFDLLFPSPKKVQLNECVRPDKNSLEEESYATDCQNNCNDHQHEDVINVSKRNYF